MRGVAHHVGLDYLDQPETLDGMTIAEAADAIGKPYALAYGWLISHGFRCPNGRVQRVRSANEIEDEINARSVSYGPCFRCGCRVCGCGRRG